MAICILDGIFISCFRMYRRARAALQQQGRGEAALRRGAHGAACGGREYHSTLLIVYSIVVASNCIKKSENVPGILGVWKKCNNIVVSSMLEIEKLSSTRLCPFFLLLQNMCSFEFKTQHVLWKCQWKPRIALFYEYRIPISILLPWTFRKLQNHYPIQVNLDLRDKNYTICWFKGFFTTFSRFMWFFRCPLKIEVCL